MLLQAESSRNGKRIPHPYRLTPIPVQGGTFASPQIILGGKVGFKQPLLSRKEEITWEADAFVDEKNTKSGEVLILKIEGTRDLSFFCIDD